MANMSSAFGTFYFDFSKTGKAPEQCIDWLKRFNEKLGSLTYCTSFDDDEINLENLSKDLKIELGFTGTGRWGYASNFYFFENKEDESYSLLPEMDGLIIEVEYTDHETGMMVVGNGSATIEIKGVEVSVCEDFEGEELTKESYIDYNIGDENDWAELMGE